MVLFKFNYDEEKKLFERQQMEQAREWFLSNPYAYTVEEVEHGKGRSNG